MKCPKAVAVSWEIGRKPQFSYGDCLKEECAWWDDDVEQCGFLTASIALKGILAYLGVIERDKDEDEPEDHTAEDAEYDWKRDRQEGI